MRLYTAVNVDEDRPMRVTLEGSRYEMLCIRDAITASIRWSDAYPRRQCIMRDTVDAINTALKNLGREEA